MKFESGPIRNAETIGVALYRILLGILPDLENPAARQLVDEKYPIYNSLL